MMKQDDAYNYKVNPERHNEKMDDDCLRKMFIGGLSPLTNEDSLREFYSRWGEVVDAVVMRDLNTNRSRGFGFITYLDPSMVDRAQSARPHLIDGKNVDPKRALPRGESVKHDANAEQKKIFVGGLKEAHDEQALVDHFSQFGNVVSVKILTDKTTGRKRGFAFVEFDDYDAVDKAILFKNHSIRGGSVDVKKCMYKQEQAKKFQTHQNTFMVPVNVAPPNMAASNYLPTGNYNPQAPYGYSTQLPPPNHYNWNNFNANAYQQPAGYGYAATVQGAWPAYANQQWDQNALAASQIPAATPPGQIAWEPASPKSFGNYQQVFNGGPQKNGNLQASRVNPYKAASLSNYGTLAYGTKVYNFQKIFRKSNIHKLMGL